MSFLRFLISKDFLKQILYAVLGFVLLIILVFGVLRIYTHHGEKLTVPDFTGLTKSEISELCKDRNLRFSIIDSVYVYDRKKGSVIHQNPKSDSKVKRNRTIFLTINAHKQIMVNMPKIVDVSLRQAMAMLESSGLKIGRIKYENDFAQNYVLHQYYNGSVILTGKKIPKGAFVDVVLGKGLRIDRVVIPEVRGLSKISAHQKIISNYLNVGAIKFDNSVLTYNDTNNAKVFNQKPKFDSQLKVRRGSFVDLWLTVDSVKIAQIDSVLIY